MMDPETKINLDNLKIAINNKYLEAEQLMLKTKNADQLKLLNQEISEIFNELIAKLELIPESLRLANKDYPSIADWKLEKTEFDNRLAEWLKKLKSRPLEPSDDAIGRQAFYSGNCLEQETRFLSVKEELAYICANPNTINMDAVMEEWINSLIASEFPGFGANIGRQVALTDSNEQQFDSYFLQNFVPIRCLGKGGFGVVFESRNKVDQRNYAIKRIRLSNKPGAREKAEREVRALERLKHRAIVGYFSTWTETPPQGWQEKTDEELRRNLSSFQSSGLNSTSSSTDIKNESGHNRASDSYVFFQNTNEKSRSTNEKSQKKKEIIDSTYLYIQMELCQKKSLRIWLADDPSRDSFICLEIFHQVLGAVDFLHDNNLIHRDLKPDNIMFSLEGVIKVGDFGLVTETDKEMIDDISKNSEINTVEYKTKKGTHTKGVGTRLYMAPEQMSGNYGKEVDIFALGLILFELFSPFSTQMERICKWENARHSNFDEKFINQNEPDLVGLAKRMLSSQPCHRPTAQHMNIGIGLLKDCLWRLVENHRRVKELEGIGRQHIKNFGRGNIIWHYKKLKENWIEFKGAYKEQEVVWKKRLWIWKEHEQIWKGQEVNRKKLVMEDFFKETEEIMKVEEECLKDFEELLKECKEIEKQSKWIWKKYEGILKERERILIARLFVFTEHYDQLSMTL